MKKTKLGNTGFSVSPVGIGGHYRAMEEGQYEDRTAYIEEEVALRCSLVEKAIDSGINYFDTTWKNEAELFGIVLKKTGLRDKVVVNGMVLGSFTGSAATGLSLEDYFDKWLNVRLAAMPGRHYDTFMINAIEEGYNEDGCERLVRYLEKRQKKGDFKAFGFSCHDPMLARKIADKFPEFQTIMVPYNFFNRKFEAAFDQSYSGNAALIAMKPLVWAEYGVPFCALNELKIFEELFGFPPEPAIATLAYRFILNNPQITTVISAVNSEAELLGLISAGEGTITTSDITLLNQYKDAQERYDRIPLFLSAMETDNLRKNFFGVSHLSRVLGIDMPDISLNAGDAREKILAHGKKLKVIIKERKLLN